MHFTYNFICSTLYFILSKILLSTFQSMYFLLSKILFEYISEPVLFTLLEQLFGSVLGSLTQVVILLMYFTLTRVRNLLQIFNGSYQAFIDGDSCYCYCFFFYCIQRLRPHICPWGCLTLSGTFFFCLYGGSSVSLTCFFLIA